jgi:hypothetical protein
MAVALVKQVVTQVLRHDHKFLLEPRPIRSVVMGVNIGTIIKRQDDENELLRRPVGSVGFNLLVAVSFPFLYFGAHVGSVWFAKRKEV